MSAVQISSRCCWKGWGGAVDETMRVRIAQAWPGLRLQMDAWVDGGKGPRVPTEVVPPAGSVPRADLAHFRADVTPLGPEC